ncbi:MAG TPA: glycosyltransferase [Gaiellaceae bacterium]|nr:glycosyltransferase [Gaiellaceae bacterium]
MTRRGFRPFLRIAGRAWLRRAVLESELGRPDAVTVLIGARNRANYRLENALRSIRAQTYPASLVHAMVVDYGSDPADAARTAAMCARFEAEYVRVDGVDVWSRSRCLNVGIRRAATKFLQISDADIVFPPRYLAGCVEVLRAAPISVVGSAMLDLPEESARELERAASEDGVLDAWTHAGRPRNGEPHHVSICATYTAFFHAVRGYDEFYEVWGEEDDDLHRRFVYLGLTPRTLGPDCSYLHQWHPDSERARDGENAERVRRNQLYLSQAHSILRNDGRWGIPHGTAG